MKKIIIFYILFLFISGCGYTSLYKNNDIKNIDKKYKKKTLVENYRKTLIAIMPIIPHFSNECLELLNAKDLKWPKYDSSLVKDEEINIVIQVNGKKRGLIKTTPNITEENLFKIIKKEETLKKYFDNVEIKRKIYVKDKLINIIT